MIELRTALQVVATVVYLLLCMVLVASMAKLRPFRSWVSTVAQSNMHHSTHLTTALQHHITHSTLTFGSLVACQAAGQGTLMTCHRELTAVTAVTVTRAC